MVAFTQTIEISEGPEKDALLEIVRSNCKKGSPFQIEMEIDEVTLKIRGSVLSFQDETLQILTSMKSAEPHYIFALIESGCIPNKEVVDFCEIRIPTRLE
jgi:hypothetical protein